MPAEAIRRGERILLVVLRAGTRHVEEADRITSRTSSRCKTWRIILSSKSRDRSRRRFSATAPRQLFVMKKKRRSVNTRRGEPTRRLSKLPPQQRPKKKTEHRNNTKQVLMAPSTPILWTPTAAPSNETKARLENNYVTDLWRQVSMAAGYTALARWTPRTSGLQAPNEQRRCSILCGGGEA